MKHFRSLLSLGAIEDEEFIETYELHRIRSQQLPKSTRSSTLSQRKRQSKQRLESNPGRLSWTIIDGKKVRALQPSNESISTRACTRRQFFYKPNTNVEKQSKAKEQPILLLAQQPSLDLDLFNFNFDLELEQEKSQNTIDLQLPNDSFYIASPSPMAMTYYNNYNNNIYNYTNANKPRLNTTLPPPPQPPLNSNLSNNKSSLSPLPPPPLPPHPTSLLSTTITHTHTITHTTHTTTTNAHTTTHPPQFTTNTSITTSITYLNPENSITSINSISSLPSQHSILNPRCSSKSVNAQIRKNSISSLPNILSPILSSPCSSQNGYAHIDSPHLDKINDAVLAQTDDEEEEEELAPKPRLATIVSQESSLYTRNNHKNDANESYIEDNMDSLSQRTSRTVTTNLTSGTSARTSFTYGYSPKNSEKKDDDHEPEEEEDVNIPFEYIPDDNNEDHNFADDDQESHDEEQYEYIHMAMDDDLLINNTFPSYDFAIMGNIGRGAYGVVDKAFHLKSCEIVAIKRSRSCKQKMKNSFKKEIAICDEFAECKYIINMLEYGVDEEKGNEICIALEYMNMGSLTTKQCDYTLSESKHIGRSVLCALAALHEKLYVHNDIKPDNILYNNNMDIKLTDFGCCNKMENEYTPLTLNNGSINFQSYEKKFLSPIRYTTKSDIYSFGITMCEILNGSHRFEKEQETKKIPYKIAQNILDKYDDDLLDFLQKCLDKNYDLRWSAKQLLQHPFLLSCSFSSPMSRMDVQRMDDLEFMIDTLINYYLHYNQSRISGTNSQNIENIQHNKNNFFKQRGKTPIDDQYSDSQRIENIANYTGYSIESVQNFIFQSVNNEKNKYLTR